MFVGESLVTDCSLMLGAKASLAAYLTALQKACCSVRFYDDQWIIESKLNELLNGEEYVNGNKWTCLFVV